MRRSTDQEGQKLQQIVRRGSTSPVRYWRAMMLPASAGGNRVPLIARLVQADGLDLRRELRGIQLRPHLIGGCLTATGLTISPPTPP